MSDDALARPSLLLARHDMAHREQQEQHKRRNQHRHQHRLHNALHRRQAAAPTTTSSVTEVIQTVSVIQVVDVDPNGSTISVHTVVQTGGSPPPALADSSTVLPTPATSAARSPAPVESGTAPSAGSPVPESSSPETLSLTSSNAPSSSAEIAPTSTLLVTESPPPLPTTTATSIELISSLSETTEPAFKSTSSRHEPFAPFVSSEDATSSSTSVPTTSSSSSSSSSSVSSTISTSSETSTSTSISLKTANLPLDQTSSSTTSTSSPTSSSTSTSTSSVTSSTGSSSTSSSISSSGLLTFPSTGPTTTGGPEIPGGGVGTGSPAAPGDATSSSAPALGHSSAPPTPVVVASVVGSVAGVSIAIIALLFALKWWRRHRNMLSLGDGGAINDATEPTRGGPPAPSGGMIERQSFVRAVPAALAGLKGYTRSSQKTDSSTTSGERGFYRVSGRKLPSVLQNGGDGYGGGLGEQNTWSGSSFYRDSGGFYGGSGSPNHSSSSPPVGLSIQRDGDVAVLRPGPARMPITEEGPFSSVTPAPLNLPPRGPDALGRSHPSQDASHASRFTELV